VTEHTFDVKAEQREEIDPISAARAEAAEKKKKKIEELER
jgi:hypothetical protein